MSLSDLFDQQLPVNRKERFFTGTVFPMLVARDNFAHLPVLFELLGLNDAPAVRGHASDTNVQFFTEYGFLESLMGPCADKFLGDPPPTRDTPDILILVTSDTEPPHLIALEAKMYDNPTAAALNVQMRNQHDQVLRRILNTLQIPGSNLHHQALIPEALLRDMQSLEFGAITWDVLLDRYSAIYGSDDYWVATLALSLDRYDSLAAKPVTFGRNMKDRLPGIDIVAGFSNGSLPYACMGRNQGLNGDPLRTDVQSGAWKRQLYEVTDVTEPPNLNWFPIARFVEMVSIGSETANLP